MFTVILVDDELWALMGIKSSVDWEKAGLRIICETTNSVEAMREIESKKPDVVFTDIRMPVYSGIDLIERSREKGISAEFIIVSGYAEFEYARHALKYGAYDYILKPINEEEMQSLISRLVISLKDKAASKRRLTDLMYIDHLYANDLTFERFFQDSRITWKRDSIQVAVLSGGAFELAEPFIIHEQIEAVCLYGGFEKYILIFNYDYGLEEVIEARLLAIINEASKCSNIGLSEVSTNKQEIKALIKQASKAHSSTFIGTETGLYPYVPMNIPLVKECIDRFFNAFSSRSLEVFRQFCHQLPEFFKQHGLGIEAVEYFNNSLSSLFQYKYAEKLVGNGIEVHPYEALMTKHKNMVDYMDYLFLTCSDYLKEFHKFSATDEDFSKLLDYIHTNFSKELYLSDISQEFHFSSAYLCELFPKKTGKTFTKYINDLRMENARELTKLSEKSMAEIAELVGFKDYFYFSKLFKKYFGLSPSNYRKGD